MSAAAAIRAAPPAERPAGARILVIDDDRSMLEACAQALGRDGHSVTGASSGKEGSELFMREPFDLVLLDLHLGDADGRQLLGTLREHDAGVPVIIITGYATIESAVAAMRDGAMDYLPKPFSPAQLRMAVARVLENRRMALENICLREELDALGRGEMVAGKAASMRAVDEMVAIAAPTDSTVLITGESGTGKELLAREIHRRSRRAAMPFVVVDCSTIVETLFESELFGHAKGSFTGAVATKPGRIELAHRGTIFFDEISCLGPGEQAKLLRAIQEREITRVGDTKASKIDMRIIAATNRDLSACVRDGSFREDLFYRLSVIPIHLPPLRERREDILLLAAHFVRQCSRKTRKNVTGIDDAAARMLLAYPWPGNVRELENLVERAVVLARGHTITAAELVFCGIGAPAEIADEPGAGAARPLRDVEEQYVRRVVDECGGNIQKAAQVLGIDRKTLRAKLHRPQR